MTTAPGSADHQAADSAPAPEPGLGTMIRSAWPLYAAGISLIVVVVVVLVAVGSDAAVGKVPEGTFKQATLVNGDLIAVRLAWGTSIVLMIAATIVLTVITMKAIGSGLTGDQEHLRRSARLVVAGATFLPAVIAMVILILTTSDFAPELVRSGLSKVTLAAGGTPLDMTPGLDALVLLDLLLVIAACMFLYVPAACDRMSLAELLARHRCLRLVMAAGATCLVASVAEVYLLYSLPAPLAADKAITDSVQKVATMTAITSGVCYSVFLLMLYWIVSASLTERMREKPSPVFASRRDWRAWLASEKPDADTDAADILVESETHDHFAPVQTILRLLIMLTPALVGVLNTFVDLVPEP